jgi:hypothetical protein
MFLKHDSSTNSVEKVVRTALDQTGGPGVFHLDPSLSRTETVLV